MQEGAAVRGGGHCSANGLVNEPAEGWQGVALRCLFAPDNKTHIAHAQNCVRQGCIQYKRCAEAHSKMYK